MAGKDDVLEEGDEDVLASATSSRNNGTTTALSWSRRRRWSRWSPAT